MKSVCSSFVGALMLALALPASADSESLAMGRVIAIYTRIADALFMEKALADRTRQKGESWAEVRLDTAAEGRESAAMFRISPDTAVAVGDTVATAAVHPLRARGGLISGVNRVTRVVEKACSAETCDSATMARLRQ